MRDLQETVVRDIVWNKRSLDWIYGKISSLWEESNSGRGCLHRLCSFHTCRVLKSKALRNLVSSHSWPRRRFKYFNLSDLKLRLEIASVLPTAVSVVNVGDKPLTAMLYNGLDSAGFTHNWWHCHISLKKLFGARMGITAFLAAK